MHLRILCKIHAAGSLVQQPYVSQGPLQDPHLWIHISVSLYLISSLQDPRLRLHVSPSIYISGSSAKSMSPDVYISVPMALRILCNLHISDSYLSIFISQGPLKIHVPRYMTQHPFISQDPLQDPYIRILISASICISGSSARSMLPGP